MQRRRKDFRESGPIGLLFEGVGERFTELLGRDSSSELCWLGGMDSNHDSQRLRFRPGKALNDKRARPNRVHVLVRIWNLTDKRKPGD